VDKQVVSLLLIISINRIDAAIFPMQAMLLYDSLFSDLCSLLQLVFIARLDFTLSQI